MNILITNQHTNNRGDESATKALIYGLKNILGNNIKITVMPQNDKYQFLKMKNIKEIGMICSIKEALLSLVFLFLYKIGINILPRLNLRLKQKINAFLEADLIISAHGGPYFGDLYVNHEIVHFYPIFIALILNKPFCLYSPSIGPFKNKLANIYRKFFLSKFKLISLRDEISIKYLSDFLPENKPFYLASDSCLQQPIKRFYQKQKIVGITPWGFNGKVDCQDKLNTYKKIMAEAIDFMIEKLKIKVVFIPQLYGKDSDLDLINEIISLTNSKHKLKIKILNPQYDSTRQQQEISKMSLIIGNRYHSIIFAAKMGTAFVPIYYEHKAKSFVESLGLENLLIDVYKLSKKDLLEKIDYVWQNRVSLVKKADKKLPSLQNKAFMATQLIGEFYKFSQKHNNFTKKEFDQYLKRNFEAATT